MEKFNINFLKLNLNYYKKIILFQHNQNLKGKNKIFFEKFLKIANLLNNSEIFIYKGNKFRFLKINPFIFFFRMGFFTFTKKPFKFLLKNKANSKNIKR